MKTRTFWAFGLAVALAASAGFFGAQALAAGQKSHHDADAAELDRTEAFLRGHLASAVSTLRQIASETTAENAEPGKEERKKAIEAAIKPLQEDAHVLLLQAHLLCIDNIADKSGEPVEQFIQASIYEKMGVDGGEVARRRETTGLGHGGLILGYLVAKSVNKPADEVFAAKKSRSWPELMRAQGVSAGQVVKLLEGKD